MQKNFLEEQQWYYLIHSWGNKKVHAFPKSIGQKVKVIVWLELKLANFEALIEDFSDYSASTPSYTPLKYRQLISSSLNPW